MDSYNIIINSCKPKSRIYEFFSTTQSSQESVLLILYYTYTLYYAYIARILHILTKKLQSPGSKPFIESGDQPSKIYSTGS